MVGERKDQQRQFDGASAGVDDRVLVVPADAEGSPRWAQTTRFVFK
jgi:hypothetical protein